jgi:galacturonokinase
MLMEFERLSTEAEKLATEFAAETGIAHKKIRMVASPYRICPLGAHIDHQGGPVLGMTINAYTILAYVPTEDGTIRLRSLNYPGNVAFHLDGIPENTGSFWGTYARGAILALKEAHTLQRGVIGLIKGYLPGGGLSSSASILLAYLLALGEANDLQPAPWDFVSLVQRAENIHIGLNNGILDQTSIVFGCKDHLLYIDTLDKNVTSFKGKETLGNYHVLIAYSGYSRELTTTGYNSRVKECREAARLLSDFDKGPTVDKLGNISERVYQRHRERLPHHLKRRATHFFNETARVRDGLDAWCCGRIDTFGRLMFDSCRSSIEQYESGSQSINDLQQIVSQTEGVIGSRFSGGGFGGCVVGFVKASKAEEAVQNIRITYQKRHPEVADQAAVYLAKSEEGVRFL